MKIFGFIFIHLDRLIVFLTADISPVEMIGRVMFQCSNMRMYDGARQLRLWQIEVKYEPRATARAVIAPTESGRGN